MNLRQNLQKLLRFKNPNQILSCGEAIQKMLDIAASKFPKWKGQNSKTFMEAFDRIGKQEGFVAEIQISHYGGTVEGDAFGWVENGGKHAKVLIHPFYYNGTLNGDQAQLFYALTALHEVFHLAARGGYDDEDMAEVVSEITGWSLPPNGSDVMTYSNFWERYLMDHCRTDSLRNLK